MGAGRDTTPRAAVSAPTRWAPPRRTATGWPWQLRFADRLDPVQAAAVSAVAELIAGIDVARRRHNLSLRALAAASGVSASVVEAALAGRCWPKPLTLGALCATVGLRLELRAAAPAPPLPFARRAGTGPNPRAEVAAAGPGELPAIWHNVAIAELRWWAAATGLSAAHLARACRLRPNTVSELQHAHAPDRQASLPVLLALARAFGLTLAAPPQARSWQLRPWQRPTR